MRGKHSGVTSDAMSGPYGTATGAITLEDTTETTRVTQHGSTLSPDPWRASTKPSTSNGSACGLQSLGQQENQKFNMDQSSRDEGPDMPSDKYCDSSATQSSAGYEPVVEARTSSPACGLRSAERIDSNNNSDASKLAAARISSIAIQSRLSQSRSSRGQTGGSIQLGGAQPPVAAHRKNRHSSIGIGSTSKLAAFLANSIIAVSIIASTELTQQGGAPPSAVTAQQ